MLIIAARPSVGKTALALHLARTMAENGKRVLFFSLEMTATELTKRLCLGTGRVRAIDFRREAPNWQSIEGFFVPPRRIEEMKRPETIRAGLLSD